MLTYKSARVQPDWPARAYVTIVGCTLGNGERTRPREAGERRSVSSPPSHPVDHLSSEENLEQWRRWYARGTQCCGMWSRAVCFRFILQEEEGASARIIPNSAPSTAEPPGGKKAAGCACVGRVFPRLLITTTSRVFGRGCHARSHRLLKKQYAHCPHGRVSSRTDASDLLRASLMYSRYASVTVCVVCSLWHFEHYCDTFYLGRIYFL